MYNLWLIAKPCQNKRIKAKNLINSNSIIDMFINK